MHFFFLLTETAKRGFLNFHLFFFYFHIIIFSGRRFSLTDPPGPSRPLPHFIIKYLFLRIWIGFFRSKIVINMLQKHKNKSLGVWPGKLNGSSLLKTYIHELIVWKPLIFFFWFSTGSWWVYLWVFIACWGLPLYWFFRDRVCVCHCVVVTKDNLFFFWLKPFHCEWMI